MTFEIYNFHYFVNMLVLSAGLALFKCTTDSVAYNLGKMIFKSRLGIISKALLHASDSLLVLLFLLGYLLLTYTNRDGIIRTIDLIFACILYFVFKRIFGCVLRILSNILRQILSIFVARPIATLNRLLNLLIITIVKKQTSRYK